jgi:hypothetical protein
MSNNQVKDAARRSRRAQLIYGGVAALANLLFFLLRFVVWGDPVSTFKEWAGVVCLLAMYALSGFMLVGAAADRRANGELWLDVFGLAVATQLGTLVTRYAWWGLAVLPAGAAWWAGSKAWGLYSAIKGSQAEAALAQAIEGLNVSGKGGKGRQQPRQKVVHQRR